MSEQNTIESISIEGQLYEIDAKLWGGKEINDIKTVNNTSLFGSGNIDVMPNIASCSVSDLDTTTIPFNRVYMSPNGMVQVEQVEHIVHTMDFDGYRKQIAYDCTYNNIWTRHYQDPVWSSWVKIPTDLKTINGQSLMGQGDIDINVDNIYVWDISKFMGKDYIVDPTNDYTIGIGDVNIQYVDEVYVNYLAGKPIYIFDGDSILLPTIASLKENGDFNVYVYTTSKDINYNKLYGTYSFNINDIYDDDSMLVTMSGYVHSFVDSNDLKTINGQSLLGSGDIEIDENYPIVKRSDGTATVKPNTYNIWNANTYPTKITLETPADSNIVNEYVIRFTIPSSLSSYSLSFTSAVKWGDNNTPIWQAGCTYEISIVDGYAVFFKYN